MDKKQTEIRFGVVLRFGRARQLAAVGFRIVSGYVILGLPQTPTRIRF